MEADVELPRALMNPPEEGDLTQDVKDQLENFVYTMYCPKGVNIHHIPDLRWHLFCKHLAEKQQVAKKE